MERLEDRALLTAYVVNTLSDTVASDGKVSLREAIQAANNNAAVNEAPAGQAGGVTDRIDFDDALTARTMSLAGTELAVTGDTAIFGSTSRFTISGKGVSRVFNVSAGANVGLFSLTITGGRVTASRTRGGAILNAGSLNLTGIAVVGNAAAGDGGGVASVGSSSELAVTESTISGNSAGGRGGGLFVEGRAAIENSTISGNSAATSGGGVQVTSSGFLNVVLRSATLFGNRAGAAGGGIAAAAGSGLTLFNTLVAGNRRGSKPGTADDVFGLLGSPSSHNLIADAGTAGGLSGAANGNIVGADLATLVDPVLRDNGGPTKTHALLPKSQAIDAGDDDKARFLIGTDQRGFGFRRFLQARVDIGAFEAAPAADLVGYASGQWFVGASTGTAFTTALWARVPNAAYDAFGEADFTGDGRADAFTLLDGTWAVGTSDGAAFLFRQWQAWGNADWRDVKTADLNGDGRADVLARLGGRWFASLSNGTTFRAPTLWTAWADTDWREFFLADVTNDDRADLIGYVHGQWWVGRNNGTTFDPPKLFAIWADAPWQELLLIDVGQGTYGVGGFLSGQWWVGLPLGPTFSTRMWVRWSNVPYVDLHAADVNGDGADDVVGRNGGDWWVSLNIPPTSVDTPIIFAPQRLYASWSNVAWKDVRVADFDGDGRDDVAGRFNGQWFVAESIGADGSRAATALWATWAEVAWQAVAGADATGPRASANATAAVATAGTNPGGPMPQAVAFRPDDEPLAAFWRTARDDEELAAELLGAA